MSMFHIIHDDKASAANTVAVFLAQRPCTGALSTQTPSYRAIGSGKLICGSQSYD